MLVSNKENSCFDVTVEQIGVEPCHYLDNT